MVKPGGDLTALAVPKKDPPKRVFLMTQKKLNQLTSSLQQQAQQQQEPLWCQQVR
jgi:hypothetical protein